jgi:hypothetical protein
MADAAPCSMMVRKLLFFAHNVTRSNILQEKGGWHDSVVGIFTSYAVAERAIGGLQAEQPGPGQIR